MARYMYVCTNTGTLVGTCSTTAGVYTSLQTGTFASLGAANIYPDITSAITAVGPVQADDHFLCSHLHNYTATGARLWEVQTATATWAKPSIIMSVDNAACDEYKKGAEEGSTDTGGDNRMTGNLRMYGMKNVSYDRTVLTGQVLAYDCYIYNVTDYMTTTGDNSVIDLVNSTIEWGNATNSYWNLGAPLTVRITNGVLTNSSGSNGAEVVRGAANGGPTIELRNCIIENYTAVFGNLTTAPLNDDRVFGIAYDCEVPSGVTWHSSTPTTAAHVFRIRRSGAGAAAEYQYLEKTAAGQIEDADNFYRTASSEFPSGKQISLRVDTSATQCNVGDPLYVDLPTRFVDFSSASSDTLTFYILSATQLYKEDVWITVSYPDDTTISKPLVIDQVSNILKTGTTELDSDTSTWSGWTSEYRYKITVDTSATGSKGIPRCKLFAQVANKTFYICPTVGVS